MQNPRNQRAQKEPLFIESPKQKAPVGRVLEPDDIRLLLGPQGHLVGKLTLVAVVRDGRKAIQVTSDTPKLSKKRGTEDRPVPRMLQSPSGFMLTPVTFFRMLRHRSFNVNVILARNPKVSERAGISDVLEGSDAVKNLTSPSGSVVGIKMVIDAYRRIRERG